MRLGEAAGLDTLNATLAMMPTMRRPMDLINQEPTNDGAYKTLRDVPADRLQQLYDEQHDEYMRLYRAEYGVEPEK